VGGALLVSIAVLASSALLSLPGWVSGFAGVLASAATMRLMGLARPAALQASHIEAPELRGTERDVPEHEMLEPAVAAAPTAPSVQDATAQQHG
jgi:hypothetical protein